MKVDLDPARITIVLTSCGRFDLLERTIDAFLALHQPGRFIVVEDSADAETHRQIGAKYPWIELLANPARLGQRPSIDRAYAAVTTPYVFHLEDDWEFIGPVNAASALKVLETVPGAAAVCFTHFDRMKLRQRLFASRFTVDGVRYARIGKLGHPAWHGYTWNPTIVPRAVWEQHGPFAKFSGEKAVSRHVKQRGGFVAYQLPGVAYHIGDGRSTARVDPVSGAIVRQP